MKKLLWFFISFLAFELVIIAFVEGLLLLSELKLELTTKAIVLRLKEVLLHPVNTITGYVENRNPLWILLTLFNLFYSAFIQIRRKTKKDGWDIHEKNAYHGSARWAKEKEILDGNFITKSKKDVREEFLQSLKGRDDT